MLQKRSVVYTPDCQSWYCHPWKKLFLFSSRIFLFSVCRLCWTYRCVPFVTFTTTYGTREVPIYFWRTRTNREDDCFAVWYVSRNGNRLSPTPRWNEFEASVVSFSSLPSKQNKAFTICAVATWLANISRNSGRAETIENGSRIFFIRSHRYTWSTSIASKHDFFYRQSLYPHTALIYTLQYMDVALCIIRNHTFHDFEVPILILWHIVINLSQENKIPFFLPVRVN